MAKNKRAKSKNQLLEPVPDWAHTDERVRRVGDLLVRIVTLVGDAKQKIDAIKADLQAQVSKLQDDIDLHVRSVEAFAVRHRSEFGKAQSKTLAHGKIGWRWSTKISISTKNTLAKIKECLSPAKRNSCINVTESVSKDGLAKLTDEELAGVQARRKRQEAFFVEPSLTKAADY